MKNPSKYQSAIFAWPKQATSKHLIVEAVAGSGKSTTMTALATTYLPASEEIRIMAFNKSIASALEDRLAMYPNVKCSTFHSAGMEILRNSGKRVKVTPGKIMSAAFDSLENALIEPRKVSKMYLALVAKGVISHCKQRNSVLTRELYEDYFDHFGTAPSQAHIGLKSTYDWVKFLWDKTEADDKVIDFDDMLWRPVRDSLIRRRDRCDWLLVDEVQDLNPLQQEFAIQIGERIIAVGDSCQAIYKFAGADTAGMANLKAKLSLLGGCDELPLSICYRCPKKVIEQAQLIVPHIQCSETAIEGEFNPAAEFAPEIGHLVLCRTTAPLVEAALGLLRQGKAVGILGRDFATTLTDIVDGWDSDLHRALIDWNDKETKRLEKRSKSAKDKHQELYECLSILLNGVADVGTLTKNIKAMFSDAPSPTTVNLMTGHRSKGLEADQVWIIRPDLVPHPSAKMEDEIQQEMNLKYVMTTRAQKVLCIVPYNKETEDD